MNEENAVAFNAFTADWKNRIEMMMRMIFLISSGTMSLTIGAYLSSSPPQPSDTAVAAIRWSWLLLALSLSSALLVSFILVISGAMVLKEWEKNVVVKKGRIIIDSPRWVHLVGWLFASTAVITCLSGLASMAIGASCLLK